MLPYVTILGRQIPSYGICTGVGILLAWVYIARIGKGNLRYSATLEMGLLWGLIGIFFGAKLLSILTQLPQIIADWPLLQTQPQEFLQRYLLAGFVYYGGFYGGFAALWLYGRWAKAPLGSLFGPLTPAFALGHSFGRLGCFAMGCCYGKPTHSHLGIAFQRSPIAPNGVTLLPVQLLEAGFVLALFAALAWGRRKGMRSRVGFGLYCLAYGLWRFVLEFFRGDAYRGFLGGLSVSQWISLVTICLGLGLLLSARKATAGKTRSAQAEAKEG